MGSGGGDEARDRCEVRGEGGRDRGEVRGGGMGPGGASYSIRAVSM